MKRTVALCCILTVAAAGLAAAQINVLFDSKSFESPVYVPGDLPGQDGWVNDTNQPTWTPPQVVSDPTGMGMGQVVEFDPPGNGQPDYGWIGAFRPAGPSTRSLVVIEWDQYRADLWNVGGAEGDNFWYADNIAWDAWWAMQWDQNIEASHQQFIFGVPIDQHVWEHMRYLFNFQARTVTVEIDGLRFMESMDNPSGFPVYTDIDGIDFEAEPTPPGFAEDDPIYVDNVMISEVSFLADDNYILDSVGATVNLYLDAGPQHAFLQYLILGSVTGTTPGFPMPGGKTLPLNWDVFTGLVFKLKNYPTFDDFFGTLDANGQGKAKLVIPPIPGYGGFTMFFAYAVNTFPWGGFVSNPIEVHLVP